MDPLIQALDPRGAADQLVALIGQHHDRTMSQEILEDLGFLALDGPLSISAGS